MMGTLGDLLVLGEGPFVVADADVGLLARACELLWSRAVAATGAGPHMIKLRITAAVVRGLRLSLGRHIRVRNQTLFFGIICIENVKLIPTSRINFLNFPWQLPGPCRPAGFTCFMWGLHQSRRVLVVKTQTLIFGLMCIENVKEIPTFRTNFSNFPWQLLGACRPAGFTCLMCSLNVLYKTRCSA